uniref:Uncharacterized protein n=1 Tax=Anser brachyrhynchus TaxID=132585 RepID=A0A8B9ID52_9AVES
IKMSKANPNEASAVVSEYRAPERCVAAWGCREGRRKPCPEPAAPGRLPQDGSEGSVTRGQSGGAWGHSHSSAPPARAAGPRGAPAVSAAAYINHKDGIWCCRWP